MSCSTYFVSMRHGCTSASNLFLPPSSSSSSSSVFDTFINPPNPNGKKMVKKISRIAIIPNASSHPPPYVASLSSLYTFAKSAAVVAKELRVIADEFVPREYQNYYIREIKRLLPVGNTELTIIIKEYQPECWSPDKMFKAAERYLATKVCSSSVKRVNVSKKRNSSLAFTLEEGEEIIDHFDGVRVTWRYTAEKRREESKGYELTFHKRHREKVLNSYLPYILQREEVPEENKSRIKLHIIDGRYRSPITLKHPMTFKILAIDMELKKAIIEDLNSFKNGKEHYRRIGKAWKRGYLLYGPPGTGKSSLIACIANHLNYDIYSVELARVESDSQLRSILLDMPSKAILVFEDIDCIGNLHNRPAQKIKGEDSEKKVTLSGFLNFMDGIWSFCGEERIIIFTTNHKEMLDPALLRPGRMDMHIHMSYCTYSAFKQLALNYLEVKDHPLFKQIEELLEKANATPAEVAGELLLNTRYATLSLQGLIVFLQKKAKAKAEAEAEAEKL